MRPAGHFDRLRWMLRTYSYNTARGIATVAFLACGFFLFLFGGGSNRRPGWWIRGSKSWNPLSAAAGGHVDPSQAPRPMEPLFFDHVPQISEGLMLRSGPVLLPMPVRVHGVVAFCRARRAGSMRPASSVPLRCSMMQAEKLLTLPAYVANSPLVHCCGPYLDITDMACHWIHFGAALKSTMVVFNVGLPSRPCICNPLNSRPSD